MSGSLRDTQKRIDDILAPWGWRGRPADPLYISAEHARKCVEECTRQDVAIIEVRVYLPSKPLARGAEPMFSLPVPSIREQKTITPAHSWPAFRKMFNEAAAVFVDRMVTDPKHVVKFSVWDSANWAEDRKKPEREWLESRGGVDFSDALDWLKFAIGVSSIFGGLEGGDS